MAFKRKRTVSSIVAPLAKILDDLRAHVSTKSEEIETHQNKVTELNRNIIDAQSEIDQASTTIKNLGMLIGSKA